MCIQDDEIPTISLGDKDREGTVKKLRSACIDVGFFFVVDHGIDEDLIASVFEQSKLFFSLSKQSKKAISDPALIRGYITLDGKIAYGADADGDRKEGFYVGRHFPADHPEYNVAKLKGSNVMPSPELTPDMADCEKFRSVIETYHEKMCELSFRLVQLLALALGLPPGYFDKMFEDPMAALNLLHYGDVKSEPEKGLFGAKEHTDGPVITVLRTDGTPGLQVLSKTGQWIDVSHRRGAFVVNLGDMLERMSNGLFRSTPHRVVLQGGSERYSLPFFYEPGFDVPIAPLDICCSEDNPPKFEPTTSGQYLHDKYFSKEGGVHSK